MFRLQRIHIIGHSEIIDFSEFSWLHVQETKETLARGIHPILRQILGKTAELEDILVRPILTYASATFRSSAVLPSFLVDQHATYNDDEEKPVSYDDIIASLVHNCTALCHELLPVNSNNSFTAQAIRESAIGKALQHLFVFAYEDVNILASEVEALVNYIRFSSAFTAFVAQPPRDMIASYKDPIPFLETPLGMVINSARLRAYRHEALLTISEAASQSGVNRALIYDAITDGRLLPLAVGGTHRFPHSLVKHLQDILFY